MFGANYFGQVYPGEPYGVTGILFDNASSSGYEAALSTYNWSHTTALSSMVLIVDVSIFATGTVSSITYNSVNLIFIRADVQGVYRNEMWYLSKPTYGANTVTVNLSTSLTSIASASSYANVFTDDPIEADAGNTGSGVSTPSVNITTINNGAYVVDGISTSNTSMTQAAGQTKRALNSGALGTGAMSDKPKATAGATNMSWSAVGITDSWALGVISLAPYTATLLEKAFTATLSFTGSFTKNALKALSGVLSFIGTLTVSKSLHQALAGTLSFVGNLTKQDQKALSGTLSFVGSITKSISYPLTATLSFIGSLTKLTFHKAFTATLSFSGSFSKTFLKALSATLSFVGSIIAGGPVFKALSASLSFAGSTAKRTSRSLTAALSFAGILAKLGNKLFSAALSFSGQSNRLLGKNFTATLSFVGAFLGGGELIFHNMTAALSFGGSITKQTAKSLTASLSFVGTAARNIFRLIKGFFLYFSKPDPISLSLIVPAPLTVPMSVPAPMAISLNHPSPITLTVTVPATISLIVSI